MSGSGQRSTGGAGGSTPGPRPKFIPKAIQRPAEASSTPAASSSASANQQQGSGEQRGRTQQQQQRSQQQFSRGGGRAASRGRGGEQEAAAGGPAADRAPPRGTIIQRPQGTFARSEEDLRQLYGAQSSGGGLPYAPQSSSSGPSESFEASTAVLPADEDARMRVGDAAAAERVAIDAGTWPPHFTSREPPITLPYFLGRRGGGAGAAAAHPAAAAAAASDDQGMGDDDDDDIVVPGRRPRALQRFDGSGSSSSSSSSAAPAGAAAAEQMEFNDLIDPLECGSLFVDMPLLHKASAAVQEGVAAVASAVGVAGPVVLREGALFHLVLPSQLPTSVYQGGKSRSGKAAPAAAASSSSSSSSAAAVAPSAAGAIAADEDDDDAGAAVRELGYSLPSRVVGKLLVRASGRTTLHLGGLAFEVSRGVQRTMNEQFVVAGYNAEVAAASSSSASSSASSGGGERMAVDGDDENDDDDEEGGDAPRARKAGGSGSSSSAAVPPSSASLLYFGNLAHTLNAVPDVETYISAMAVQRGERARRPYRVIAESIKRKKAEARRMAAEMGHDNPDAEAPASGAEDEADGQKDDEA